MATYQSFPGAPPSIVAGGLKFGNNQVLVSETQPGATAGQFLVATSSSTLGFVTVSPAVYVDGLNTSTVGSPVTTNSSTPLIGQYLRTKFSTTNAIWDWAYQNGVNVLNNTLVDQNQTLCFDTSSVAIGVAQARQGVAIGSNAFILATQGVAIGVAVQATNSVAVGNASTSLNEGVAVGLNCQADTFGVCIGAAATTGSGGVRVGWLGSVTTGVAIGKSTSATSGISIGTSVASSGTNSTVIGAASNDGGANSVTLVGQNNITQSSTGANQATLIGYNNSLTSSSTGGATNALILGSSNTFSSSGGSGNQTQLVCVGYNNSQTTSGGSAGNIILGNNNAVNGGIATSITIGQSLTNGKDNSYLMGCSGNPLQYCTNIGTFMTHRTITSSAVSNITSTACLGRVYNATQAGAANLTLPTGTALDSDSQITNNLWVGMSFNWKLIHSNTGVITILSGAGNTYTGPTLGANACLDMLTIRTGVNTWVTYGS